MPQLDFTIYNSQFLIILFFLFFIIIFNKYYLNIQIFFLKLSVKLIWYLIHISNFIFNHTLIDDLNTEVFKLLVTNLKFVLLYQNIIHLKIII
jgi:hypothetical protein